MIHEKTYTFSVFKIVKHYEDHVMEKKASEII